MIPQPKHLPASLSQRGPKPPPLPKRDATYLRVKKALADLTRGRRQRVVAFADTLRDMPKVHTVRTMGVMGAPVPAAPVPRTSDPAPASPEVRSGSWVYLVAALILGVSVAYLAPVGLSVATEIAHGMLETANAVSVSGEAPESPHSRRYTVRRGDTLGIIARRELGSPKRWRDIVALNAAALPDPNVLEVGAVLHLPSGY